MANRKYRHNVNEQRISNTVNGDLLGYDDLFLFTIPAVENFNTGEYGFNVVDLFLTENGGSSNTNYSNDEQFHFNYEVYVPQTGYRQAFKADGTPISSVFNAIDMTVTPNGVTGLTNWDTGLQDDTEPIHIYINGQFNALYIKEGNALSHGAESDEEGASIYDMDNLVIKQWGKVNVCKNWERFCKDTDQVTITATDEPNFEQGVSLNRAFEDSNVTFSEDAKKAVNAWNSNKMGNGGRVFENRADAIPFDGWSQSGGGTAYAYYMRNDMSGLTNKGANMVPTNISGWAGYADVSFSDSFQGATGIHNWENLNTANCIDMQYFAWKNTRAKSLGTMRNLITSKVTNFTAMFGYCGVDSYGAEGELLVDPSNWDMKSATTLFYMLAQEELGNGGNWSGELNWKTMKNVIDLHSVLKNRTNYVGARLDEFAPYSGNVVLFRSAFAGTGINHDFSNWDFSGVDATRTDVQLNENNASGIMGGFVRDCENMSLQNTVKLLEALDRPFGQGGLPVTGVNPEIGTASQEIQFGTSYQTRFDNGDFASEISADATLITRGEDAIDSLFVKGFECTGLDFMI